MQIKKEANFFYTKKQQRARFYVSFLQIYFYLALQMVFALIMLTYMIIKVQM